MCEERDGRVRRSSWLARMVILLDIRPCELCKPLDICRVVEAVDR
jgi:hypothetical protein